MDRSTFVLVKKTVHYVPETLVHKTCFLSSIRKGASFHTLVCRDLRDFRGSTEVWLRGRWCHCFCNWAQDCLLKAGVFFLFHSAVLKPDLDLFLAEI